MLLRLMALVTAVVHMASAQGGTVLRQGDSGETQSVIVTQRTTASLSCESGDMVVRVNFTQPFKGIMYAHKSRSSPCRIHGTGSQYYELRIPLKGCGTWQESPRVFVNNVTIRFHPALELEEDETKTIVCRYPPPLTQTPGGVHVIDPTRIVTPTPTTIRVATAKLTEVEILIIICLLLFLSLLTLGIGIAYFCLRRRNIRVVRKVPAYSISSPPSQLTRLSSSALQPPSSLLSSVLGHTVRIPRAVPYSARVGGVSALSTSPDHHYEDYRSASSSSGEGSTNGEASETTVSSSSAGEDQLDGSRNLLFRKGGQKSIFTIPKAILRRASPKKWWTEPSVHRSHSHRLDHEESSSTAVKKRLEMEDQTVTTMLDSENHNDEDPYYAALTRQRSQEDTAVMSFQKTSSPPVYAQIDKNKKIISALKQASSSSSKGVETTGWSRDPIPESATKQRQVILETPEKRVTSEEVTKNTTVSSSVRREVKETRISSAALDKYRKSVADTASKGEGKSEMGTATTDLPTIQEQPEESTTPDGLADPLQLQKRPKSILIRDVSDVYLTTTVETELRELKTKVSRDVVQQHAKSTAVPKQPLSQSVETKDPPPINWNVVIRQKKQSSFSPPSGTDLDASCESNADSIDEPSLKSKPLFDVKIRSIPPQKTQPKKSNELTDIPPLEMPETITKLKEALMPKTEEDKKVGLDSKEEERQRRVKPDPEQTSSSMNIIPEPTPEKQLPEEDKTPPRSVRWEDDTKAKTTDGSSTVSSTDSFRSTETLRERSSSEVLEVAPTLPSLQQPRRESNRPSMLERSTSEIVTSPDDHVRWVGGVAPVLENLSPEFLANIPVAIQGGFFNRQKSLLPEAKRET